jgi:hypothetical protein
MPRIEQLRHTAIIVINRLRYALLAFCGRAFGRLVPRQRAVLFFPLAIALATASIVFAARSSSGSGCTPARTAAAGKIPPRGELCRSGGVPYPLDLGH